MIDLCAIEYDNCYNEGLSGTIELSLARCDTSFSENTQFNLPDLSYSAMSNALKSTEKDIVYAICNWGEDSPWLWASVSTTLIAPNLTIDSSLGHCPYMEDLWRYLR